MHDGAQGTHELDAVGMLEHVAAHGDARAAGLDGIVHHLEHVAGGIHAFAAGDDHGHAAGGDHVGEAFHVAGVGHLDDVRAQFHAHAGTVGHHVGGEAVLDGRAAGVHHGQQGHVPVVTGGGHAAQGYTAVPMQFAAGPDGSDFSEDQTKFSDVCVYDTEKAADYWAKGLEELGESEITLDIVVDADDAPQKVAQVLKEQWETTLPGLTVNLVVEPKKQRVEDMQNGNFQLGLTRWGPDYADPMTYLGMWVTDNSNNYGLWSNADYDAIIDECTTGDLCTDAEGRWARLYDAEKIVMDEAVIYPLYTQCNAEMLSSKVTGVEYHPVAINRVYKDAVKTE